MRSYFIIIIAIILYLPGIVLAEEAERKEWLTWFKKENLSVKGSFFGGRIRHSDDSYVDANVENEKGLAQIPQADRFEFNGRSSWGGEFGVGYKIKYGVEFGISYMFQEINDYHGSIIQIDPVQIDNNPDKWYIRASMDIDSRALMFNTRVYLDELTGWDMGRFSPYIMGSAGRATHKVTDLKMKDNQTLNTGNDGRDSLAEQIYDSNTSHKNRGEFAFRLGLGSLLKLTDHISIDAHASFMDWGEARASRYYQPHNDNALTTIMRQPMEPDVRTIQGTVGIQINF
jgi:opacity protein-like surface antigen